MTFEVLQTLLDYHYWARDRMLAVVETLPHDTLLKPLGNSFSSIFDTLVHLYGADWIWCKRWHGESPNRAASVEYVSRPGGCAPRLERGRATDPCGARPLRAY